MSTFKVTVERVKEVQNHPNADSLDICKVEGLAYSFVTGRDEVSVGDLVVYFPIESQLPEAVKAVFPEAITKKLHGKNRDRVKTATLRGVISQGLQVAVDKFPMDRFSVDLALNESWKTPGYDLTTVLGVTKFEPPEEFSRKGVFVKTLPVESPFYDIESCDRHLGIVRILSSLPVLVTEKLEGTNFSLVSHTTGEIQVCQRSFSLVPEDMNNINDTYWKAAIAQGLIETAKVMSHDRSACITLRGELLGPGIQKNIYGLSKHEIRIFDIMEDGQYIDAETFLFLIKNYELKSVPILESGNTSFVEYINGRDIGEVADGESLLRPGILREGLVFRPMHEQAIFGFGRLILKQHSRKYLAKSSL